MSGRTLPATLPADMRRLWKRRVAGTLMVGTAYGPYLLAKIYELDWHWFGPVTFRYGEFLSLLPGVVLTAVLAPRVAYRRRDALTLLFLPPQAFALHG